MNSHEEAGIIFIIYINRYIYTHVENKGIKIASPVIYSFIRQVNSRRGEIYKETNV